MKKSISLLFVFILAIACSKDDPKPTTPDNPDAMEDPTPELENPKIADNVVVISGDTSDVKSSETDLENGIYIIEYTGSVPTVAVNDIIVGDEDDGFLRRVNAISVSGSTQTIETEQAALDEVFENADLSFNLDLANLEEVVERGYQITSNELIFDYVAKGVSIDKTNTFSFNMDAVSLSSGGLSFKVSGNATFNPNFNFDAEIRGFSVKSVVFEADNANLSLGAGYELSAGASVSVTNDVRLVRLRKRFTFVVGTVPVVVTADVRLNASLNTTLDATFTAAGSYTKTYTVDTGVNFDNGQWTGRFNTGESTSIDPLSFNSRVNLTETLAITPNVQVKFYGVVAPYVEPEMFAEYKMSLNENLEDWDSSFGVGLNLTMGVKAVIFGRSLFDFARTGTFSKSLWDAPKTLEIVSGNEQEGDEEKPLEEPLRLKVTDNLGNPIKLAPVHIELVTESGQASTSGSVDFDVVDTDEEGIAEFIWTLGKASDEEGTKRFAKVSIRDSKADDIGEPIQLEAEINSKILKIVSGNEQKADEEMALPSPLVVQVTNSNEEPLEGEEVFIELITAAGGPSSSGSIAPASAITDAQGNAEFTWTLGKTDDEDGSKRFAEVTIRDEEGNEIEQDEPVIFEADINPTTGCGSFVDLSLFNPTQCGEVVSINTVLISAVQTTAEDCAAGACSFGDFNGGIGAFPARILFDLENFQDLIPTEILLKYTDFCGSGCTKAFLYDQDNNLLTSMENTTVGEEAEFKFTDGELLSLTRFVAFSSCEGALTCFDMTFQN